MEQEMLPDNYDTHNDVQKSTEWQDGYEAGYQMAENKHLDIIHDLEQQLRDAEKLLSKQEEEIDGLSGETEDLRTQLEEIEKELQ